MSMARQRRTKKAKEKEGKKEEKINALDLYGLTPERVRLLEVMAEPTTLRKRKIVDICKEAGVSRQTYYSAVADPEFQELLKKMTKQLVSPHLPQLINAYVKYALGGSVKHGDALLKMSGLLEDKPIVIEDKRKATPLEQLNELLQGNVKNE